MNRQPLTTGSAEPAPAPGVALVAIGGGTGLSALLRGLKTHVGAGLHELTGVVTVTDDGGSSGRLRRDFGVPAPGDIRSCLVALADDEDLLARLFQYRFPLGDGLGGHSFGNLFLTALTGITGDFHQAILTAEAVLSVRGRVLPATVTDVRLLGRGASGTIYEGESAVGRSGEAITRLELVPAQPPAFPAAVAAIEGADAVLLGPGSLYTSILPNLLIPGIRRALAGRPVILLLNLMTQPGETDGMMGAAHLEAIECHVGPGLVKTVLVNSTPIPDALQRHYAGTGSVPVTVEREALANAGVRLVEADLLAPGDLIRHDSGKLARTVLDLVGSRAG